MCNTTGWVHANKNGLKKYRVVTDYFPDIGLTESEGVRLTQVAAAAWNEMGNGGHFRFAGTAVAADFSAYVGEPSQYLPELKADCDSAGIDYSLVVASDAASSAMDAQARSACGGTQFVIVIYGRRANLTWKQYGNFFAGDPGGDLPALLTHEFGHTTGIGHPTGNPLEEAVMLSPIAPGGAGRHLYEYDFKCSAELSGRRDVDAVKIGQLSDGSFTATTVFDGVNQTVKAATGLYYSGSTPFFSGAMHRSTGFGWTQNLDSTITSVAGPSPNNGAGIRAATFRENAGRARILYSFWKDSPTQYDFASHHRLYQVTSLDGFASVEPVNTVSHCSVMTAFLQCSSVVPVQTNHPPAVAWLGDVSRTVFAWVHSSRDNTAADNEIRISIGLNANEALASPTLTGIRAVSAPGLACMENFNGVWDCVLVYQPLEATEATMRSRRFGIAPTATGYGITFDSETSFPANVRSYQPIALWYHQGTARFYSAVRNPSSVNEPLVILYSSDARSWTLHSSTSLAAVQGPSAVSNWRGTGNVLVLTRK